MTTLLVVHFTLLLARVGTFVAFLPIFHGQPLPRLVKAGLALTLTVLWAGDLMAAQRLPGWLAGPVELSWPAYGLALGREALLGALFGFLFGLFLAPAHIAGEYLSQELGLSFGNLVGAGGMSGGPLTQLFDLLAALLFFTLDLHHVFFTMFYAAFGLYPVGSFLPGVPVARLIHAAALFEEWGLVLIAPAALCLFLTTVSLAILSRASPQIMNIYAVGFPLRLIIGLITIFVLLPGTVWGLAHLFQNAGGILRGVM